MDRKSDLFTAAEERALDEAGPWSARDAAVGVTSQRRLRFMGDLTPRGIERHQQAPPGYRQRIPASAEHRWAVDAMVDRLVAENRVRVERRGAA